MNRLVAMTSAGGTRLIDRMIQPGAAPRMTDLSPACPLRVRPARTRPARLRHPRKADKAPHAAQEVRMLEPARARRLAEHALRLAARAGSDEAEVTVHAEDEALNRFTHEHPVQNVLRGTACVAVRVRKDGRQGKASTGTLTDEAVARTVERALAVAKLSPAAELLPLPGPQQHRLRGAGPLRHDADATGAAVGAITEAARAAGCRAAGIHHATSTLRLLMNSRGLAVHDWDAVAEVSVSAFKDDGAGWACDVGASHEGLDAPAIARRTVQKAVASRAPRAVPPGRYTVVLEPAAVSSLLLFTVSHGFGAQQVMDGSSFLAGK